MSTNLLIREGCEFYPYSAGRFVLRTPDHRHFLVSSTTKEILEALRKATPLNVLFDNLSDSSKQGMTVEELQSLIEKRYSGLGVLACPDDLSVTAPGRSVTAGLAFLHCWDLIPASPVKWIATRLTWLYGAMPAVAMLLLIAAAHLFLYSSGLAAFHPRLPHGSPLVMLLFSLLSILAHEMGHATALSRFKAVPGKIGFGLYLLMPTFFADVSEIWRLPRHARLVVDLGGVYFQQAMFVIFAVLAKAYSSLDFAAPCVAIDTMTLLALNPVFRFDGYWFLADWLELPKLHRDAIRLLKDWFHRLLARFEPAHSGSSEECPRFKGIKSVVFATYAAFCNLFLLFSILLSVHYLHSGLFGFLDRVPDELLSIRLSVRSGDWAAVTDQIVSIAIASAFSATAVLGLSLYFSRLFASLRRSFRRWRTSSVASFVPR